jgi:hypothetical protein
VTQHLSPALARRKLEAAAVVLGELTDDVEAAIALLVDSQPGYPSGDGGPRGKGAVSDRTGSLAVAPPDAARSDLDWLCRLLDRACADLADAARIAHRWQPPSPRWREVLATEAAADLGNDGACTSHLRVQKVVPPRTAGSQLCRWCEDMKRDLGGMPPTWLVDRHDQGRRLSTLDVAKARREVRTRGKRR